MLVDALSRAEVGSSRLDKFFFFFLNIWGECGCFISSGERGIYVLEVVCLDSSFSAFLSI